MIKIECTRLGAQLQWPCPLCRLERLWRDPFPSQKLNKKNFPIHAQRFVSWVILILSSWQSILTITVGKWALKQLDNGTLIPECYREWTLKSLRRHGCLNASYGEKKSQLKNLCTPWLDHVVLWVSAFAKGSEGGRVDRKGAEDICYHRFCNDSVPKYNGKNY